MRHRLSAAAVLAAVFAAPPLFANARGDAKAQVTFGTKVAQHGLWREAMYRFGRAVEIDPTDARAWNNLAIACKQLDHIDRVRKPYEKAIALAPNNDFIRQNYDLFLELRARHSRRPNGRSS